MGFQKFGQGEILPEDDEQQRTASTTWTEQDQKELAEENKEG